MAGGLSGQRILIVEDEFYIASDMKRMLIREQAIVIGPVADLKGGLALATNEALDAAILDVNLGERRSFAIADRLMERGVPYLLVTGYEAWSLPKPYRDAPRLEKPFGNRELVERLEYLVSVETS